MQQFLLYASHHYLLLGAAVAAAVLVTITELRARATGAQAVAPAEAIRLMNGGALLIDVRGLAEFVQGHIAGARNVPGAVIASGAEPLSRFKDKPVIAYCDTGATASAAARQLGRLGFKSAFSLRGGLAAWRQDNLPLVKG